jgi:hypothetical protein
MVNFAFTAIKENNSAKILDSIEEYLSNSNLHLVEEKIHSLRVIWLIIICTTANTLVAVYV